MEENIQEVEAISDQYLNKLNDFDKVNKRLKLLVISSESQAKNVKEELVSLRKYYVQSEKELAVAENKIDTFKSKYSREKVHSLNKKFNYRDEN